MSATTIFGPSFLESLKTCVDLHHLIYPTAPPRGAFFEALVEKTFRAIHNPLTVIETGGVNQPGHDIHLEGHRISLKTETGIGTRPLSITITKLCTTEREPWDATALKAHVLAHLERYDSILMLGAVWAQFTMRYQLGDIPVPLIRLLGGSEPVEVGKRGGRRSLAADVFRGSEIVFRVHFDGPDGKCSVRNLRLENCTVLLQWEKAREAAVIIPAPEAGGCVGQGGLNWGRV